MKFLVRVFLKAVTFLYLLPHIRGISFHGGLIAAVVLALVFSLILWLVEAGAVLLATYLTIVTLGLALLVLIPLWIFGFWILPAIALKLAAEFLPHWLTITGWWPAVLGGLVLLVISMVTGGISKILRSVSRQK